MSSLCVRRSSCPASASCADRLQRRSGRVHEQLQRGQALLTVDDAARLQITEDRLLRLNDDRAEKVLGSQRTVAQPELGQPPDVLPQRRPLLLLLPDVRPLERRHHEVLRLHEDLRRPDVRLHTPHLAPRFGDKVRRSIPSCEDMAPHVSPVKSTRRCQQLRARVRGSSVALWGCLRSIAARDQSRRPG